jgi:hypothetical protein
MKASKLITKEQNCQLYGQFIKLKLYKKFSYEQFLTLTIKIN